MKHSTRVYSAHIIYTTSILIIGAGSKQLEVADLRLVLWPVISIIEFLTPLEFGWEPQGYVSENTAKTILIEKSCSGLQFLMTACLVFGNILIWQCVGRLDGFSKDTQYSFRGASSKIPRQNRLSVVSEKLNGTFFPCLSAAAQGVLLALAVTIAANSLRILSAIKFESLSSSYEILSSPAWHGIIGLFTYSIFLFLSTWALHQKFNPIEGADPKSALS